MTEEIIIAGFGGQGVLSMGKIMIHSAVMQDLEVSWMPSYGPEMRGGTANVTVIVSTERISSPILRQFDTAIILNQQSLDKFEGSVKQGGTLIYDTNGITRHPERKDISVYSIDAVEEAGKMNNPKIFNMIVLGGYLKIKPIIKTENVVKGLQESLPERYHHLIPLNQQAIERGMEIIRKVSES
ncbi:MAG TPA: 2-oxoacid:acceptor oxidoreductase family protein [Bacteroidales bacterium]|nr:2-oxoglutarate ferredoxin oxidoreductase subunit gamma [Bacteroidales bacterium]OQB63683.1 MAG: NADH-dependent phenylglyoxylate dehydrogenase subunit gamma [Bacteroidetes bacterium ADurb.Bin145]NMD03269.1 2-oxoglutarate ferredoxin oxidoreductase subunit gamma [Bacteroidales bacterium]HOU01298.1 2-oxoacid:acceptor oxidoreductase family protein [Bacteroidales bacterium]HQG62382.1 2-oxoacid:acceptor oxidoreductase family protein [Bacteroidales bacterium]